MARQPNLEQRSATNSVELEKRFATGKDPTALLDALYLYINTGLPIPEWLRRGFSVAWHKGFAGDIKSWNEVFGRPATKTAYKKLTRDLGCRDKIWELVADAKGREAIDNELFDKIGRDVGINRTDVKKLYAKQRSFRGRP
jgi:hypothetical protein